MEAQEQQKLQINYYSCLRKMNYLTEQWRKKDFRLIRKRLFLCIKFRVEKNNAVLMEEKYNTLSEMIKNKLSTISHISLTTDIWTDMLNTKSYISLTAHFLLENVHKSLTIGVTELNDKHTSANLEEWLLKITSEWKIKYENIVVVVSDNAANIKKAITDAFSWIWQAFILLCPYT